MKRPATWCALAVLALAAWEIGVCWHAAAAAPRDDGWQRARASLDGQWQPGDLVVFAPAWVDQVGRRWFGDLLTVADVARMDAARYARVWEVSTRGAHSPDATGTVASDQSFGAVRVRRWEKPAAVVKADLAARAKLREIDFTPRNCVPMKPPAKVDLSAADASTLVVHAGIADFRSRKENTANALLRVLVDDVEVAHASIGNESGWFGLPSIALPAGAQKVTLDAIVDPEHRGNGGGSLDLCVAAEARQ